MFNNSIFAGSVRIGFFGGAFLCFSPSRLLAREKMNFFVRVRLIARVLCTGGARKSARRG